MHQHFPGAFPVALCVVGLVCSACQPPPARLVVRAGRLIDGTGAPPRTGVRITMEDGSITAIEDDTPGAEGEPTAEPTTAVVDARDLTVLPGLIDAHVHVLSSPACTLGLGMGLTQPSRNLQAWVEGGITTVADLGSPTDASLSLRRYVGSGRSRGPRVLTCGSALTAVGGYPRMGDPNTARDIGMVLPVQNAREARHAVMDLAEHGVDCIKIMLQSTDFDGTPIPTLDEETVCSAVHEAHNQELRAFAHAIDNIGYAKALHCGIDALVHGNGEALSDEVKDLLRHQPTVVVPTHGVFEGPEAATAAAIPAGNPAITPAIEDDLRAYAAANDPQTATLPDMLIPHVSRAAARANAAARRVNTAWLVQNHTPLAYGSDAPFCFNWPGDPVAELGRFVEAGLTPIAALQAASAGSAQMLNLQDALGRIAVGYRGDLIAVQGRPDESLEALHNVRHVVIDGVVQDFGRRWYAPILWGVEMISTWLMA